MPEIILLVEDNPDDRALTLRALGRGGVEVEVRVARDGQEALDLLLPAGGGGPKVLLPRLVLLDLSLPRVGGLEVLRRLRADPRTRGVPVVVLSSSNEEADLSDSYEAGASAYVRKPVDFSRFVKVLDPMLRFWLEINEVPHG